MQIEVERMNSDWRTNPALNAISVILSVIGLIISAFSDLSTLVKILVIAIGVIACLYVIFSKGPRQAESSTPQLNQDSPPMPSEAPVAAQPATNTASPLTWKDRLGGFLAAVVMFGVPGILLFRSNTGWQHIVGIILLAIAVLGSIGVAFPEMSNKIDEFNNKMDQYSDRMDQAMGNKPSDR